MDEGEWLPMTAAAERLGIAREALRKRVTRGSITCRKEGGQWLVLVPAASAPPSVPASPEPSATAPGAGPDRRDAHIAALEDEVQYLRGALDTAQDNLRREQSITAALTQRVPELRAAPQTEQRRSWWRSWFGKG